MDEDIQYGAEPLPSLADVGLRDLRKAVWRVAVAAGTAEALPALTGVEISATPSTLSLTTTDRFQIATACIGGVQVDRPERLGPGALVSARSLKRVLTGLRGERVTIGCSARDDDPLRVGAISLTCGGKTRGLLTMDAAFPLWRGKVPATADLAVGVEAGELAVEVGWVIGAVELELVDDEITVRPVARGVVGPVCSRVAVVTGGAPGGWSGRFNARTLSDALGGFSARPVTLHLSHGVQPIVVTVKDAAVDDTGQALWHLVAPSLESGK